jgi:putative tricarboxylic transport membrane protein
MRDRLPWTIEGEEEHVPSDERRREAPARPGIRIRSPSDLLAGGCLLALSGFALWSSRSLDAGTLRAMGPGMVPRSVAAGIGLAGLVIAALSMLRYGPSLGRWPLRGPIFVTLGVVVFALTIRTLGLVVAGPLVVIIGGSASPETRPRELLVFAVVITALCVGLFRYLLSLPIPVLIIPGVITL